MPTPDDLGSRTLRFWGVIAPIYGLLLGGLTAIWIPWKSPAVNVGFLIYAALYIIVGVGLWRRARWGWRLGVAMGFLSLVIGLVVVGGLLSAWSYLHAIFGDFGFGASIGALLFASVAAQLLGLFPGLLLRALLRREVRQFFGAGRGIIRAIFGLLAVPFLTAGVIHQHYKMNVDAPLSADAQQQVTLHLRAALKGEPRPEMPALQGISAEQGLYVTLWDRGQIVARVSSTDSDLAKAVGKAADALKAQKRLAGRPITAGRLKIDRVVGIAGVISDAVPVVALSVNPGKDGLRRTDKETERTLLPDDLIKRQGFGNAPLVPGIRELRLGLDAKSVLVRLGIPWGDLERVRTEGWVEFEGGSLPVVRGNTPSASGPESWHKGAIEGGDFVLRQLMPDGRFHYQYYPLKNQHPPPNRAPYSLPRHAGTVYALALLFGHTKADRFKKGAEKAIAWLNKRIPPRCGPQRQACVANGKLADLGSTALTVVGMLEYTQQTGDKRYVDTIRKLLAFVRHMQRPDGDFSHVFHVDTQKIDTQKRLMFFSEEAALALVMGHSILGDDTYLAAAERALDFLTGPKYSDFLGQFIYGADHWTCIAAEAAWPSLKKPVYLDFCRGYAEFIRRLQYEPGRWDNDDFRGHYGFSGLMVPQSPAAAGFTEAVVSTYQLAEHHQIDDPDLYAQMAGALDALVRDQLRPANSWMMPDPKMARGGIRRSLVEQEVRIDFTQHALSALIRGADVTERLSPRKTDETRR